MHWLWMMSDVSIIYAARVCDNNPGIAAFGIVFIDDTGIQRYAYIHNQNTTNIQIELLSVIAGLALCQRSKAIILNIDSHFVCKHLTEECLSRWERNGWGYSTTKQPIKYINEWLTIHKIVSEKELVIVNLVQNGALNRLAHKLAKFAISSNYTGLVEEGWLE